MLTLETLLKDTKGIPPRFLPKLKKLGIETVGGLLYHLPTRYEDFSKIQTIAELEPGTGVTIFGTIVSVKNRQTWHRRMSLMEAEVADESGTIRATWFNQPYLVKTLPPGTTARFAGRVTQAKKTGEPYLVNPTYEVANESGPGTHTGRIVPVYSETRGLTSKGLRFLIEKIFNQGVELADPIPPEVLGEVGVPDLTSALRSVHFPENSGDEELARKRFAFEGLLLLQLKNIRERNKFAKLEAPVIQANPENIKSILSELPFEVTASQKRALWEIVQDLERGRPMNRLLQGDVGSGKTAVAVVAALHAASVGVQTAFMAPTEILARQHYRTIAKLFPQFEGGVALVTGSTSKVRYGAGMETEVTRTALQRELAKGSVAITIGTHALISGRESSRLSFKNLGLVMIDEQHRFGVRQRATLVGQKSGRSAPHFLSMSATPIPRTLALTVFGDLDVSIISELPKNRLPITTRAVPREDRTRAYAFIREQVKNGRQVFVICPRIEPTADGERATLSDIGMLQVKTVREEHEKLSKKVFPELTVGMIHGKMSGEEKGSVMGLFERGKIDILISTSIIEVGVDIPNASVMVVEGSERFGLAQLYQFRGRVGRGEHASYCLLFTESKSPETARRLRAITSAKNGFELAEADLKIRGPGEFFGESQTGMPDIAMEALRNPKLVASARNVAQQITDRDPELTHHPILRSRLNQFSSEVHGE